MSSYRLSIGGNTHRCQGAGAAGLLQGREYSEGMLWPGYLSPRQGSRKGPSTPNPTPCHYTSHGPRSRSSCPALRCLVGAVSRNVVARGGDVGRWGPCGNPVWGTGNQACDTDDLATALLSEP